MSDIRKMNATEAVERIADTLDICLEGVAPYALVLGSGFSHGLVPTAREIVESCIPLWLEARKRGVPYEELESSAEKNHIAASYWKRFLTENPESKILLSETNGLPKNYVVAYQQAFSCDSRGALEVPAIARDFQKYFISVERFKLNPAHFLLASILGSQPLGSRIKHDFKVQSPLSDLILTTNFDPFLQIALQMVNQLYFMSDTPDLGLELEFTEQNKEAIHLVYVHGSIHRRSQKASETDIKAIKEKNGKALLPALQKRGVIVLGYSGWDDAIVEALSECPDYQYNLYWCGLEDDPEQEGAFGPKVLEILRKPSACYVKIDHADGFINQLHNALLKDNPRILSKPMAHTMDLLEKIDLTPLEKEKSQLSSDGKEMSLQEVKEEVLNKLRRIENDHFEESELKEGGYSFKEDKLASLLQKAQLSSILSNYDQAIEEYEEILNIKTLSNQQKAKAYLQLGNTYYRNGLLEKAISAYTSCLTYDSSELKAKALFNRGVIYGHKGKIGKQLADYSRIIEMIDLPVEQKAKTLFNRGALYGHKGEVEKELSDYSRVIEMVNAPNLHKAKALTNRGIRYGQKREVEKELADFTQVIEMQELAAEHKTLALYNRGVAHGHNGEVEKELADYTQVIEMIDVSDEQKAKALVNRGITYGYKGEVEKQLADHTRVIETMDASNEQKAKALLNRGVTYGHKGEVEKQLADYTRVIEMEDVSVEQRADALFNLACRYALNSDLVECLSFLERWKELCSGINQAKLDDTDFDLVRENPEFQTFLKGLPKFGLKSI